MKKIFILNGTGGCGKDTFVSEVNKFAPSLHISIVTPVKELAKTLGWDGGKTEADRLFLYELKAALDHYNDSNYAYVQKQVELFKAGKLGDYAALFIDMREKHQVDRGREEFGAKTILLKREDIKHITSNEADKNVFDIDYDIVLDNRSLEDLTLIAKKFAKDYILND